MSHVLKYKRLAHEDGTDISADAVAIFNAYHDDGRIEGVNTVKTLGGNYVYIRFIDSATADAYIEELKAIDETSKTGSNRSDYERYDED